MLSLPSLVVSLALLLLAPGSAADHWVAPSAITAIDLDHQILADMGIDVVSATPSARAPGHPGLAFRSADGSRLEFRAPGGAFQHFDAGRLVHEGGFVLRLPDGELVSLEGVDLRVAPRPDDFDWFDAGGRRWFVLRDMQFTTSLDRQELLVQNVSIHASPELAARLGRPALGGAFVGTANVTLPAMIPPEVAGGRGAGETCQATPGDIDVALTRLSAVSQLRRQAGVRVALTLSARLENVGVGTVEWFESIQPLEYGDGVGAHPYLSMSLYRLDADGSFVQLGVSDVKHAFRALNFDFSGECECEGDAPLLYPGCGDIYGGTTNANRQYLGPRDEVSAYTGAWTRIGSHFDQCLAQIVPPCDPATDDADDYRDHWGDNDPGYHDDYEHRLVVPDAELLVADARYFADAWYIVADDVDLLNGMGRQEVDPNLQGNLYSFSEVGDFVQGSILDVIPGASLEMVDTGEGRLQLAVTTTDLGNDRVHYEYALMNFDFDRRIETFRVPRLPGVVENLDSRGLGDDPARDWTATVEPDGISWQAPPGASLGWGTMVSFGFDADRPPAAGDVQLEALEPGAPSSIAVASLVPVPEPDARLAALAGIAALAVVSRRRRRRRAHGG